MHDINPVREQVSNLAAAKIQISAPVVELMRIKGTGFRTAKPRFPIQSGGLVGEVRFAQMIVLKGSSREKSLQPFIENKYKTTASKTIIGQSLGGLLAAEILLKKPNLFNKYIIISPSLWWNNGSLLNQPADILQDKFYAP